MQNQFPSHPNWTEEQKKVLLSSPNVIVSGCAGSGKTLLACHIAIQQPSTSHVAIMVFTKSLRTFISNYVDQFDRENITVLYEYEWVNRDFPKFDLIIVDEFQDFSYNDIKNIIYSSKLGVYLFGDSEQRIYLKNFQKENTIDILDLIKKTNFEHFQLTENFRISEENKNLISSIYNSYSLKNSKYSTGIKPQILHFESIADELNWLKNFLLKNSDYKNIGIFLKQNDSFVCGYPYKHKVRKEQIFGIMELYDYLKNGGITCYYKHKNNDNLDFSNQVNINIMTYHSSKGLEFDCVILPFANYANDNYGTYNLPYVGMTRASKKIIITYAGLVAEEYSKPFNTTTFQGNIIKRTPSDEISSIDKDYLRLFIKTKDKHSVEIDKIRKEYQHLDISDCNTFKYDHEKIINIKSKPL
jgi:ATP-dependent exoDNAse (exonuclease V) beta subunit